jgi:uncharacterized protein YjlB
MAFVSNKAADDLPALVNRCQPELYRFEDDGKTPNNARLPMVLYPGVIRAQPGSASAAVCEELFAAHGWGDSWRNGIHGFLHFHTRTHEVLGIARGEAEVQFGGDRGRVLTVKAGDVAVLPAGTGHRRISASVDLLVVGAYPSSGSYDQQRPGEIGHREALERIARVAMPALDPVYGPDGPLTQLWAPPG